MMGGGANKMESRFNHKQSENQIESSMIINTRKIYSA